MTVLLMIDKSNFIDSINMNQMFLNKYVNICWMFQMENVKLVGLQIMRKQIAKSISGYFAIILCCCLGGEKNKSDNIDTIGFISLL